MNGILRAITMIAALSASIAAAHADKPQPQPAATAQVLKADANGALQLPAADAVVNGATIRVETLDGQPQISQWRDPADTVSWKLRVPSDGRYLVRIETAADADGSVLIVRCAGKLALSVPNSGGLQSFKISRVGEVTLHANKDITLTLKPVVDGWHPIHVRKVELVPLP